MYTSYYIEEVCIWGGMGISAASPVVSHDLHRSTNAGFFLRECLHRHTLNALDFMSFVTQYYLLQHTHYSVVCSQCNRNSWSRRRGPSRC